NHLAKMALWHAIRGEDGRGPATALTAAVAGHFRSELGAEEDFPAEAVGTALHLGTIDMARLAELTQILFDVAAAHDPVALRVVGRQVNEIVAMATVAARRLELLDAPVTVVLGGGVVRARHPLLLLPVQTGIVAAMPKATVTVVDHPPVLGAALSCLDAVGASIAAHAALRTALADAHPRLSNVDDLARGRQDGD